MLMGLRRHWNLQDPKALGKDAYIVLDTNYRQPWKRFMMLLSKNIFYC